MINIQHLTLCLTYFIKHNTLHVVANGKFKVFLWLSNISLWFPVGLMVKNPTNAGDSGDMGLIPGWNIPWWRKWQPHSSILAKKIPCTEETGKLQSIGLQRFGHNWVSIHMRIPLHIYIYIFQIFFHLSVRHLSCFNIFAIVNNAAMNIGVHISFELVFSLFLDIYPGVELLSNKYFR